MKNVRLRIGMIATAIGLIVVMTSCGGRNGNKQQETSEQQERLAVAESEQEKDGVKAAFLQFGLDLEKVKPNVAKPYDITLQYGNKVDQIVYYKKAAWMEKSETDIAHEIGTAYNERMFEYIKSVSSDSKIYANKTMSSELKEIEKYGDLEGLFITWSFKYNGMWIDVYPNYSGLGKEIGISMNGSGNY